VGRFSRIPDVKLGIPPGWFGRRPRGTQPINLPLNRFEAGPSGSKSETDSKDGDPESAQEIEGKLADAKIKFLPYIDHATGFSGDKASRFINPGKVHEHGSVENVFFRGCEVAYASSVQAYMPVVPSEYAFAAWKATEDTVPALAAQLAQQSATSLLLRVGGSVCPTAVHPMRKSLGKALTGQELRQLCFLLNKNFNAEQEQSVSRLLNGLIGLIPEGDDDLVDALTLEFAKLLGKPLFAPGDSLIEGIRAQYGDQNFMALFGKKEKTSGATSNVGAQTAEAPAPSADPVSSELERRGSGNVASVPTSAPSSRMADKSVSTWFDKPQRFESVVSGMAKGNYPYAVLLLSHPSLGPLLHQVLDAIPPAIGSANLDQHPLPRSQTALLKNALRELKGRKRDLAIVTQDGISSVISGAKTAPPDPEALRQAEKNRAENTKRTNITDFSEEEFQIASTRLSARLFTLMNAERYGGPASAQLMGLANGKIIDAKLSLPRPLAQDYEVTVNDLLSDIQGKGGL
jgi:hypothetical protein